MLLIPDAGKNMSIVLKYFGFWSVVWLALLVLPPGSREIITSYRLNFTHGLVSSIVALACMAGKLDEDFTAMCTTSYFLIDFINNLLNDFVFKVANYQSPNGRKVEYFHHIFCFAFAVSSQLYYKSACTFETNPFITFMLSELSTPFLIAWRYYPLNSLGMLFAIIFFLVRIVYFGFVFIPECIEKCDKRLGYFFGGFFDLLNVAFMVLIVMKLIRKTSKGTKGAKKAE